MPNSFFRFKEFTVYQNQTRMKITTDACLLGAYSEFEKNKKNTVLDLGAGTGVLSLMVAQKHPLSTIRAIEIDKKAVFEMQENIQLSPYKDRISCIHADIRDWDKLNNEVFDGIISNPPYFNEQNPSSNKEKSWARHETEGIGMEQLLGVIKNKLSEKGTAYIMYPYMRLKECKEHLKSLSLQAKNILIVSDTPTAKPHICILALEHKKIQKEEAEEQSFFLKRDKETYSDDFIALLKPYYLYL